MYVRSSHAHALRRAGTMTCHGAAGCDVPEAACVIPMPYLSGSEGVWFDSLESRMVMPIEMPRYYASRYVTFPGVT